jgi:uncharacterized protein GlcG (DUF336 family)
LTPKQLKRRSPATARKATELKLKMCIAVTDEAGDIKAFLRMDGAPKLSIDIAQNKAYTAASFSMPTHAWFDFIKDDPPLLYGITHTPRLTVLAVGFQSSSRVRSLGRSA